ncbi:MAG: hypothetical protein V1745_03700 [Patescibacteria group bacterium]
MRDIFEVVVGPEEYRKEGILIPDHPFVDHFLTNDAKLRTFIRHLRRVCKAPKGEKIPAIFALGINYDMEGCLTFDDTLLSGEAFRWEDLHRTYLDVFKEWISSPPAFKKKVGPPMGASVLISTLKPFDHTSHAFGASLLIQSQTFLWASRCGYPIGNRIDRIRDSDANSTLKTFFLEFRDGAMRLVPPVSSCTYSREEEFPLYF